MDLNDFETLYTMTQQAEFGAIKITGEKSFEFLQGQLTCDVGTAKEFNGLLGAHCNVKGRVLFNFRLFRVDKGYLMQLPQSMVDLAILRLNKFAIFSKTKLEAAPALKTSHSIKDDILAGIPWIYPETSGLFTPHELNLPALNAVSFNKGCYTGQEIVARMHYRGKLKSSLKLVDLPSLYPLGQKIISLGGEEGELVNVCQDGNRFRGLVNCYTHRT